VVAIVDGSAAAAGTGPGAEVGGAIVDGVTVGAVGLWTVVVVAVWVGVGIVVGSIFDSGFGSAFGSGFAVGVTLSTVGGVDGRTTMMLGSGAAVAGTIATGTVDTGIVEDPGVTSVFCVSASTALDVSLSLVCRAAS
jgi:hypothetical protein